jgi:hypothetical protein
MNRLPAFALSAVLAGCNSLAYHESLDEPLPPPAERSSIGAWKLDDSCTGAIQTAEGHYFWVNDCSSKIGYGWCDFGLRLEKRSAREYVNEKHRWSFRIEEDGTLTETYRGEKASRAKSDVGICHVRARPDR